MTLVYFLLLLFLMGDLKKKKCANRNNPTERKQLMAKKRGNGQRKKVRVKVRGNGI